jgi:hypothetical protein
MIRLLLVAVGAVAVSVAEKAPGMAHAAMGGRIVLGAIFGLPCLALAVWLQHRATKAKAKASTSQQSVRRYTYPLGGSGPR